MTKVVHINGWYTSASYFADFLPPPVAMYHFQHVMGQSIPSYRKVIENAVLALDTNKKV
jgi:hypothetical protein